MEFLGVRTDGYSYVDMFVCRMDDKGSVIICGDHGEGKTDLVKAPLLVLSGDEYKSIDHPITKGKKRMEINVDLKVEAGDEITLLDHIFRCNVGDNITIALVETPSGLQKYTLFNSTSGELYKGTPKQTREIVYRFLGRFPDPHKLDQLGSSNRPSERAEFLKIVASMSKTKEGEPIDFTPFIVREAELQEQHSTQKAHLKVLKDDLASMPVPQDHWAKIEIDQKAVSDEIQLYNAHEIENARRVRVIQEVEKKLTDKNLILSGLVSEKTVLSSTIEQSQQRVHGDKTSLQKFSAAIENYTANNPIVEPEDTELLTKEIEALQLRFKTANEVKEKNQKIKDTIIAQTGKKALQEQAITQVEKEISEKIEQEKALDYKINLAKSEELPSIKIEVEKVKVDNKPLIWEGEKDPEDILEVMLYLNGLMTKAVSGNKQVADRLKYEEQGVKIEATEKGMKETTESKNQVKADEMAVIEASQFPHPGIQIRRDDKDKIDVWVKDKHEVWNTYNDTNHSERMFQSVNIVTHGAGGDLKLLFVNEGYALLPYKRKQIIEAANRKGFKVMMEAFTAEEGENAIYLGSPEKTPKDPFPEQPESEKTSGDTPAWGNTQ